MKKATLYKSFIAVCLIAFAFTVGSCHKEGLGGNSTISGTVYHHSAPIPNCIVYIKFNTSTFPGDRPENYDSSVTADAKGAYSFPKVYAGDYYLYGIGFDNSIMEIVKGGVPVTVKRNKTAITDVPVTE